MIVNVCANNLLEEISKPCDAGVLVACLGPVELCLAFPAHYCQILAVVHKMWLQLKIADIVFSTIIGASESGLVEHALNDLSTRHHRKFL